ncbi:hypothetical protein EZV62_017327 [Acer yangbiense]|uniref:DWNN domain-containing protein n=1 Tax=Acer yangbiense TaxID=1000413 RepID=A0A5C7HGE0_9ROSI|nr:hypothetical protein EZV62_017327 [Acer yangbiense]
MGEMLIPRNTSVLIRRVPGRPRMLEPQPPQGYVCHRCKVPGHIIQHCPTNGDPKAAFEKEIEGLPSPTISASSKGEQKPPPGFEETLVPKEITDEGKAVIAPPQTRIAAKAPDVSEATHESMSVKEPAPASQVMEEQVQQQKKKKKKKKKQQPHMLSNDLQWKNYPQDMMHLGPSAYNNPYWNEMQSGYVAPFGGAMPYMVMGYGMSPIDTIFGGVMPQDPFGAQGYMMPVVPPQREFPRDREYGREVSSSVGDVSSMKSKSLLSIPQWSNADHHQRQWSIRSSPEPQSLRPSKRKSDHSHHDRDSETMITSENATTVQSLLRKLLQQHGTESQRWVCFLASISLNKKPSMLLLRNERRLLLQQQQKQPLLPYHKSSSSGYYESSAAKAMKSSSGAR